MRTHINTSDRSGQVGVRYPTGVREHISNRSAFDGFQYYWLNVCTQLVAGCTITRFLF